MGRYKPPEECRQVIREYFDDLDDGTDDNIEHMRDEKSTRKYKTDLRCYDDWLDERGIESVMDVTPGDARAWGSYLANGFNGTTKRNRWDRVKTFHDWLVAMEYTNRNPMERWNDKKRTKWGMTKDTKQEQEMEDGERYAVTQDDVRTMEKHVKRHRVRDQLIIRIMWQTGMRRGELSHLELDDIDRENREITIRKSISKSKYTRVVSYQPSLDGLLADWIDSGHRDKYDPDGNLDYLLVSERGKRMRGERINEIIREAADDAGINRSMYTDSNKSGDRRKISSHNLRVGYGTYMVNETDAGLWEVSKLLGHSSVKITEKRYVDHDDRAGLEHSRKYGPE